MTGAGDLDQLISIEAPVYGDDGSGGTPIDSWTPFASVWARMAPVRASEAERQGGMRNVNVYLATLRTRDDLTGDMRIVWKGKNLNIREIREPAFASQFMTVVAESGVTQ